MRRVVAVAMLLAALAAPAAVRAQSIPQVPPPALLAPGGSVGVPILFQWTPVNPGNVYNLTLQGHGRPRALGGPLLVTYELQISDEPDVTSHVLFDFITTASIYTFENQNIPGSGFTPLQQPGIALPGGLYHWRVRALVNNVAQGFSSIGAFNLNLQSGGGASTPLHDVSITDLRVTVPPAVGSTSAIITTVQNTGTFSERGVPLSISVNGLTLDRLQVPPTAAGEIVVLTTLWTPASRGQAAVTSVLDYSGANSRQKIASIAPVVSDSPNFVTTMHGTLALDGRGYALADDRGREIAQIAGAPGALVDFAPLLGKAVVVHGNLSKQNNALLMSVTSVALALAR